MHSEIHIQKATLKEGKFFCLVINMQGNAGAHTPHHPCVRSLGPAERMAETSRRDITASRVICGNEFIVWIYDQKFIPTPPPRPPLSPHKAKFL